MFDAAKGTPGDRSHVLGPFPSRFVTGAADGEATDVDDLNSTLLEYANLIGILEATHDGTVHAFDDTRQRRFTLRRGERTSSGLASLPKSGTIVPEMGTVSRRPVPCYAPAAVARQER